MSSHSKFSPSGAHRWLECPGSLSITKEGGDGASEYAAEGTAAHALAHRCWMLDASPEQFVGGDINGITVTQEMTDAVQIYLDTVDQKCQSLPGKNKEVLLEIRLDHPELDDFGGTLDCLIVSDEAYAVIDFKYGAGVAVDVDENPQLGCYAVLALTTKIGTEKYRPCEFTIVQPRAHHADGPVRSWSPPKDWLESLYASLLTVMEGERDGEFKAGNHCRWCPAKANCPELYQLTLKTAQEEFAEPEMTTEKAAEVLALKSSLKIYLDAIEKWVHGQLDKGVEVPGYKLVNTFGNRRYAVDEETVVRKCRNKKFGKKDIYETRLLSPTQLEKVVGKDLVASLVERPHTGTTVVPESDKRPAVVRLTAQEELAEEVA